MPVARRDESTCVCSLPLAAMATHLDLVVGVLTPVYVAACRPRQTPLRRWTLRAGKPYD
jgi:hypothetical protein